MTEILQQPDVSGLCECGCGQPTRLAPQTDTAIGWVKGQPIRFINGHQNMIRPRIVGYHMSNGRLEHVQIAEQALGRKLRGVEEVHHVDGDSLNNRRSNLVICQDRAYHSLLHVRTRVVKAGGNPNTQKICNACARVLDFDHFYKLRSNGSSGRHAYCKDCSRVRDQRRKGRS